MTQKTLDDKAVQLDVFDFEDLNVPIPDHDTLNRIAMRRLLLNLRPTVKDADANNAAKLVLTYTKALIEQKEVTTQNTVDVVTRPQLTKEEWLKAHGIGE